MMDFSIATSLDEALDLLAAGARPIAGGTDLVVGARHGKSPFPGRIVAIDRLEELKSIDQTSDGLRIGALATHAQLMASPAIVDGFTAIADASALVGSPSTRNVGTLGGNVMNGSPAMDTGAPLMVLGAQARLASSGGVRSVGLNDLWVGPGRTSASPDELCISLDLPERPARSGSAYVRLEYRRAMEIAVVGAAASVQLDADGSVATASIALAAVAPTIVQVDGIAEVVEGRLVDDDLLAAVASAASEQASPISDLRASDDYRRHTVGVMAKRSFAAAVDRANGNHIPVPVNRALGIGAAS